MAAPALGAVEMALVLEETGRTLAAVPFFETAVLAVQAVLAAGSPVQQAALLPGYVSVWVSRVRRY